MFTQCDRLAIPHNLPSKLSSLQTVILDFIKPTLSPSPAIRILLAYKSEHILVKHSNRTVNGIIEGKLL